MNRVTKGDLVQPETGIRETGAVETDRRYKILVIEDDEDIQVLLTCLLRDQGYDVETASD
ncbi:MAG: hypothetical protein JF615_06580, partial [Asticcacaulis sp.]|nr:hypothetical protein [Asticcacaulis sp.]